ncbi:MAG: hypothetical protein ABR555_05785 [Pyrinomonadaceae bacterium]
MINIGEWSGDIALLLTWRGLLLGILIFVITFVINLAIVSFILVKLPPDYFKKTHKTEFWCGPRPALHAAMMVGKNALGILLVVLGMLLSIPGVPGQGLLTILLGIMLLNFPGKRRFEQKLIGRPHVLKSINGLRKKFDRPPIELD